MAPRSHGLDFEELLEATEAQFAQAAYRHRELGPDLEKELPHLAAAEPQSVSSSGPGLMLWGPKGIFGSRWTI